MNIYKLQNCRKTTFSPRSGIFLFESTWMLLIRVSFQTLCQKYEHLSCFFSATVYMENPRINVDRIYQHQYSVAIFPAFEKNLFHNG